MSGPAVLFFFFFFSAGGMAKLFWGRDFGGDWLFGNREDKRDKQYEVDYCVIRYENRMCRADERRHRPHSRSRDSSRSLNALVAETWCSYHRASCESASASPFAFDIAPVRLYRGSRQTGVRKQATDWNGRKPGHFHPSSGYNPRRVLRRYLRLTSSPSRRRRQSPVRQPP